MFGLSRRRHNLYVVLQKKVLWLLCNGMSTSIVILEGHHIWSQNLVYVASGRNLITSVYAGVLKDGRSKFEV